MSRKIPSRTAAPRYEEPETVPLLEEEGEAESERERIKDAQEAFEELEAAFLPGQEPESQSLELSSTIGANEFVCRSCFLAFDRRRLGDTDEMLCADCSRGIAEDMKGMAKERRAGSGLNRPGG